MNESYIKSILLFIPRIITSLLSSLAMDDKGWSLKKILAVYATVMAGKVTIQHACKENAIAFTIVWLLWAGILVGIYSFKDISDAVGKLKGTPSGGQGKDPVLDQSQASNLSADSNA